MSMTNPDSLATKADLHEMYGRIYPFLEGGGSGGSGGHTIEDSTGNPLTQRDIMQFSDSFAPTDDSTNEVTKIELNKLDSGEIDDIVTPLPSVQSRYHEYSTDEHIVGKYIDGSYIYELTIEATGETNLSSLNINEVVSILGVIYSNDNQYCFPLGFDDKDNFKASTYYNRTTKALVTSVNNFTLQKAVVTIQYTKSSS